MNTIHLALDFRNAEVHIFIYILYLKKFSSEVEALDENNVSSIIQNLVILSVFSLQQL